MNYKIVRLHRLEGNGVVKAFVDVEAFDALLLKGIRIVQGKRGLFVSMPRQKGADGIWYEQITTVSKEAKDELTHTILNSYGIGESDEKHNR